MSSFLDIGVGVSYEEKGLWVFLVVMVGSYVGYLAVVLGRTDNMPPADIRYAAPMLWAIGIAVAASIVGRIVVEIAKPSDMRRRDTRDKDINRFGEYVGGVVLAIAMVAPLGLALAEAGHFWIANAMYAAFVLANLTSSVVKLVAYRRGL